MWCPQVTEPLPFPSGTSCLCLVLPYRCHEGFGDPVQGAPAMLTSLSHRFPLTAQTLTSTFTFRLDALRSPPLPRK